MAPADPGEQAGPGEVPAESAPPDPTEASSRRVRDDDALHPVRRLHAGRAGRGDGAPGGWAPTGAVSERRTIGGGTEVGAEPIAAVLAGAGDSGRRSGQPAGRSRRTALLGVLGLALAIAGASTAVALLEQSHPVAPTTPKAIPAEPAAEAIGDLRMYSQSTGWAQRLTDGAVLHTTQGVQHWTVASPLPGGRLVAVAYVGPQVARALTVPAGAATAASVETWTTQDGGRVWSPGGTLSVQGFDASLEGALDFVDPEHGWYSQIEAAAGLAGTALFRTLDGGAQWSEVASTPGGAPGSTGVIPGACYALTAAFISDSTGWMTGTCLHGTPPFYATHDGGQSWVAAPLLPLATGLDEGTSFPPTFSSGLSGTLVTETQSETGVSTSVFATTDGGLSWGLRSTTAGAPAASDFLDAEHGWLVTDAEGAAGAEELYATGDGGSSWTRVNAFPYEGLSLDFLTPEVGWAAADLGQLATGPAYLVQTGDGGRSWAAVLPSLASPSPSP